ncbi:MAG: amidase family protein [Tardiphaga sp.]
MLRNVCVANLTGHPAISIPCGMHAGLPVGLMLTGRHFEDASSLPPRRRSSRWGIGSGCRMRTHKSRPLTFR